MRRREASAVRRRTPGRGQVGRSVRGVGSSSFSGANYCQHSRCPVVPVNSDVASGVTSRPSGNQRFFVHPHAAQPSCCAPIRRNTERLHENRSSGCKLSASSANWNTSRYASRPQHLREYRVQERASAVLVQSCSCADPATSCWRSSRSADPGRAARAGCQQLRPEDGRGLDRAM